MASQVTFLSPAPLRPVWGRCGGGLLALSPTSTHPFLRAPSPHIFSEQTTVSPRMMLHAPNICSKEALQQRSRKQRKRDQPHPRSYLILAQGLQITFLNQSLSLFLSPSPSPSLCVSNFGCLTWHLMQHWTSFPSGIDFIYFLLPSIRRIKSLSPFSVWSLSQPGTPGFCFDLCPLRLTGIAIV